MNARTNKKVNMIVYGWSLIAMDLLLTGLFGLFVLKMFTSSSSSTYLILITVLLISSILMLFRKIRINKWINPTLNSVYFIPCFIVSVIPGMNFIIWLIFMSITSNKLLKDKESFDGNKTTKFSVLFLTTLTDILFIILAATFTWFIIYTQNKYENSYNYWWYIVIFAGITTWVYIYSIILRFFKLKITYSRPNYEDKQILVFTIMSYIPIVNTISAYVFFAKYCKQNNAYHDKSTASQDDTISL